MSEFGKDINVRDTIYRQQAIDAIEKYFAELPIRVHADMLAIIHGLPSAQPEIVRCKDCKHYYFAENRVPKEQSWVCDVWHVDQTAHMGYCFKAERRSDDSD